MAWIEFHPIKIKKLQKFKHFRKTLNWSVNEALGFFGSFWGEVMDLRESGDITGWTPEYIAEIAEAKSDPERLWNALTIVPPELKDESAWIDRTEDGKILVHDWLDSAGLYLIRKYGSSNRDKLVKLWKLHGKDYGNGGSEQKVNKKQMSSEQTVNLPILSFPDRTKPDQPKKERAGSPQQFIKPTPAEVAEYAKSIGFDLNAEQFCSYYESVGWTIGKNPMKNWKAAVRTWKTRGGNQHAAKTNGGVTAEQGKYDKIEQ